MKKLFALLVLAFAMFGFTQTGFADEGAKECAEGDTACLEEQKKKKADEEEPECD